MIALRNILADLLFQFLLRGALGARMLDLPRRR